ncbi:MAG TPA: PQQ-binding-like beta-propeller repeat protein [Bryobacteraceae bacterium]|nr:PQQ-binding-like beta-propeller repeat protein [Bryobacteraceae bacterium]
MIHSAFARTLCWSRLVPCAFLVASLWAADPDGAALYKARCAACHDNGSEQARIPKREEIAARPPEAIMNAMLDGAMITQAAGLNVDELKAIARFLTGKEISAAPAVTMGKCEATAKKLSLAAGDWNGWSNDLDNSRFQSKPGLTAADIPKLKFKWAFGFPGDNRAYAQPTVAAGRLFIGSAGGTVYSLDAATGCVYWTFKADGGVRAAISIVRAKTGGRYVAYFGDLRAFTYAVDAETGALIWKMKVEDHPAARVTGSPVFHDGRLFVPVASLEEGSGRAPQYECCTFRGSLVALDAETGRQLWKSFSVLDPPKATRKSKVGTQLYGPAGAAIWSAPTIDTKRKLVYAATGDSYTDVDINTSDAVLAFNLDTGSLVWVSQMTPKDNFIVGCPASPNCPEDLGPDYDFGSAPILRNIGGGKQILVAGQKSGVVWGLDPDQRGKVVWQTKLGAGSALGGVEWGHGADSENTYVAISDSIVRKDPKPGISALKLATGETVWSTPAPDVTCTAPVGCRPGQSAAVSVIPGAVFSGALNGHFRAYSTKTGEILWDFDTAKTFETVNKVPAKGGSINGAGPAIANGMVFTNSGYGGFGGSPGNVLLAFSVDGK